MDREANQTGPIHNPLHEEGEEVWRVRTIWSMAVIVVVVIVLLVIAVPILVSRKTSGR